MKVDWQQENNNFIFRIWADVVTLPVRDTDTLALRRGRRKESTGRHRLTHSTEGGKEGKKEGGDVRKCEEEEWTDEICEQGGQRTTTFNLA